MINMARQNTSQNYLIDTVQQSFFFQHFLKIFFLNFLFIIPFYFMAPKRKRFINNYLPLRKFRPAVVNKSSQALFSLIASNAFRNDIFLCFPFEYAILHQIYCQTNLQSTLTKILYIADNYKRAIRCVDPIATIQKVKISVEFIRLLSNKAKLKNQRRVCSTSTDMNRFLYFTTGSAFFQTNYFFMHIYICMHTYIYVRKFTLKN